jgi:hypothetical protein
MRKLKGYCACCIKALRLFSEVNSYLPFPSKRGSYYSKKGVFERAALRVFPPL